MPSSWTKTLYRQVRCGHALTCISPATVCMESKLSVFIDTVMVHTHHTTLYYAYIDTHVHVHTITHLHYACTDTCALCTYTSH